VRPPAAVAVPCLHLCGGGCSLTLSADPGLLRLLAASSMLPACAVHTWQALSGTGGSASVAVPLGCPSASLG
jgi:hypothetical protein